MKHKACLSCGKYKGKEILNIVKEAEKKEKTAKKAEKEKSE